MKRCRRAHRLVSAASTPRPRRQEALRTEHEELLAAQAAAHANATADLRAAHDEHRRTATEATAEARAGQGVAQGVAVVKAVL